MDEVDVAILVRDAATASNLVDTIGEDRLELVRVRGLDGARSDWMAAGSVPTSAVVEILHAVRTNVAKVIEITIGSSTFRSHSIEDLDRLIQRPKGDG